MQKAFFLYDFVYWTMHTNSQKMYSLFKTQFFEGHHSLPRLILSVFIKLCWAWGAWACASPPCPCLVIHKSYLPSPLTSNLNEGLALRNCFLFCFSVIYCPLCSYVHLFLKKQWLFSFNSLHFLLMDFNAFEYHTIVPSVGMRIINLSEIWSHIKSQHAPLPIPFLSCPSSSKSCVQTQHVCLIRGVLNINDRW